MINIISILNFISIILLIASFIIIILTKKNKLYNRFLLAVGILLLFFSECTNVLEHTNITSKFDQIEDILELLFFPVFIFALYTSVITQELHKRTISENKLNVIFNQSLTFIGLLDKKGILLEANETALKYINKKPEDVYGLKFWDTPWWTHSSKEREKLMNAFVSASKGQVARIETKHIDAKGKINYIDFSITPIFNENKEIDFFIPEGKIITKLKDAQFKLKSLVKEIEQKNNELNIALEKVNEADKIKSTFINNISHEIRTPLNGILGFIEIIKNTHKSHKDIGKYLDIVYSSSQRLFIIIEDILDFSMIINNNYKLTQKELNILSLFKELYYKYQSEITDDLKFKVELSQPEIVFKSDFFKLKKIFTKLLDNAFKYTNKGNVSFGIIKNGITEDAITFFVKDTGIGIPKEMFNKIFEPFTQLELDKTTLNEGNGLGLTIAKNFAEMMGGKIWLESEPDNGSSFFFSISKNL